MVLGMHKTRSRRVATLSPHHLLPAAAQRPTKLRVRPRQLRLRVRLCESTAWRRPSPQPPRAAPPRRNPPRRTRPPGVTGRRRRRAVVERGGLEQERRCGLAPAARRQRWLARFWRSWRPRTNPPCRLARRIRPARPRPCPRRPPPPLRAAATQRSAPAAGRAGRTRPRCRPPSCGGPTGQFREASAKVFAPRCDPPSCGGPS